MVVFLYLTVLVAGLYGVSKLLLPEMTKPSASKNVPEPQPQSFDFSDSNGPDIRIKKLETFLYEKNKDINLLTTELRIAHVQVRSFDKIKILMEDEIHRLREQNRIFRSELGLPTIELKESSLR